MILEDISYLEGILTKNKIRNYKYYGKWKKDFNIIFNSNDVDVQLFIILSLIYFIGHVFLIKNCFNNKEAFNEREVTLKHIKEIQKKIKINHPNLNIIDFKYFTPIFEISEKEDLSRFNLLINSICHHLFKIDIQPIFLFDFLIQNVLSPVLRHKAGQFYTPPFLVKKMIKESYKFGEKVLDPCCGTGNFLIEIIKKILTSKKPDELKIKAINSIYGYDINPISVFITKVNFIYLLKELSLDFNLNLFVVDSLFPEKKNPEIKFDLIIGNPPWYTLRDIQSLTYQNKIKSLANDLEIKPLPKNVLNIEISSIFFYQASKLYMKNYAKIFFVMTKGVITGSHTSRFRNFFGFKSIKVWTFSKAIEKVFNIDFICIFAQKSEKNIKILLKEIPSYHFNVKRKNQTIDYYKELELKLKKIEILVPYSIEYKGNRIYSKKFISKKKNDQLITTDTSFYKKLFHKDADLNPRNLIFIKHKKIGDNLAKISPDERIFKRAKDPWIKKEFCDEIIEEKYLFKVIKSTELVRFYIYDFYHVFLPLSKDDLSFKYDELTTHALSFYDKINKIYVNLKKETTKHDSLMDNLNRWGKLINQRQLSPIKVVYNNSGSILNSAVIKGDFLVTGDLSFYDTNNLDEAYYITAILNSPILTKQIQIKKSSRHIFKIPFEFPIPKYNFKNENHQNLAKLGQKCSSIVQSTVDNILISCTKRPSKLKIQKILNNILESTLVKIDKIIISELKKIANL